MTRAVKLRDDYSASDLRRLAARSQHANAARRLLTLAAIRDGASRLISATTMLGCSGRSAQRAAKPLA